MATPTRVVCPGEDSIKIVKWKVKKDSMVMKGAILALYEVRGSKATVKLKSTASGIIDEICIEAGMLADPGAVLLTLRQQQLGGCTHPTVMKDMCADCGADLRREPSSGGDRREMMSASVAMVHNIPELIVSQEQALELGREDELRLLKTRKLVLLVDLDQTLIHTTNDNIPPKLKDVYHFQMWQGPHATWYHTKLRPYTRRFLERVSQMYELHICTFGVRMYAHTVARLIDPDEKFFSHRILSRDECFDPQSKTANLKALFPCGDAMVCIIDDREDVWNNAPNQVHVKPYRFFQGTADINAPAGLDKTENDNIPIVHKVIDHHNKQSSELKGESASKSCTGDQSNVSSPVNTSGVSNDDTHHKDGSGEGDIQHSHDPCDPAVVDDVLSQGDGSVEKLNRDSEMDNESIEKLNQKSEMNSESIEELNQKSEMDSESIEKLNQKSEMDCESVEKLNQKSEMDSESTEKLSVKGEMDEESVDNVDRKSAEAASEVCLQDKAVGGDPMQGVDTASPQNEITAEEQLAQDLCVSSDSDSDDSNPVEDEEPAEDIDPGDEDKATESNGTTQNVYTREEVGDVRTAGDPARKKMEEEIETDKKAANAESPICEKGDAPRMEKQTEGAEEEVEWDDEDDYLLHLEEILTRIHKAFYSMVDEDKQPTDHSAGEVTTSTEPPLPDLKSLIPYVKRKTLKGCNIVFSGVVPLNTPAERSRAYIVAKALGATVQQDIIGPKQAGKRQQGTTHLVAAKPGTGKHKTAIRTRGVHIVHLPWLWACWERWERCEEQLFPLGSPHEASDSPVPPKQKKKPLNIQRKHKRKAPDSAGDLEDGEKTGDNTSVNEKRQRTTKDASTGGESKGEDSMEQQSDGEVSHSSEISGASFADTVNPLLSFSDQDLECMDKEVDELMAEDESGSDDENDEDRSERFRSTVLGVQDESGSSSDSLSGDLPRGWNLRRKSKSSPRSSEDDLDRQQKKELEVETEDTENELYKFQKTMEAFAPESESNTSFADSIGSVDDEIAEAVEKEFLSSL